MTKKAIELLILIIFLIPTFVFASDVNDCDTGSINCICEGSTTAQPDDSKIESVSDCKDICEMFAKLDDTVTGFSMQCNISGQETTLSQNESPSVIADALSDTYYEDPQLSVEIPGLTFTPAFKNGDILESNYFGEYLKAVYDWMIPAASLLAIVMLMLGGLQWMLARGDAGKTGKAQTRIKNAIIGLVLLLSAYSLTYFIQPDLLTIESLKITNIDEEEFPPAGEDTDIIEGISIDGEVVEITGDYIISTAKNNTLNPAAVEALRTASIEFHELTGKNIKIASATRTITKQATLFYDNCLSNSSNSCSIITCNPASGSDIISGYSKGYTLKGELSGVSDRTTIINSLISHANVANCPHTSTIAVDAWCDDGGGNYKHNPTCQKQLSEVLNRNGFCRISAEAWHFELNSMHVSSSCSVSNTSQYIVRGKTHVPDLTCNTWDYKHHSCP